MIHASTSVMKLFLFQRILFFVFIFPIWRHLYNLLLSTRHGFLKTIFIFPTISWSFQLLIFVLSSHLFSWRIQVSMPSFQLCPSMFLAEEECDDIRYYQSKFSLTLSPVFIITFYLSSCQKLTKVSWSYGTKIPVILQVF